MGWWSAHGTAATKSSEHLLCFVQLWSGPSKVLQRTGIGFMLCNQTTLIPFLLRIMQERRPVWGMDVNRATPREMPSLLVDSVGLWFWALFMNAQLQTGDFLKT